VNYRGTIGFDTLPYWETSMCVCVSPLEVLYLRDEDQAHFWEEDDAISNIIISDYEQNNEPFAE